MVRNKASSEAEPELHQLENEMHTELLAAIGHLSPHDQDLLALRFGAGLSNLQISQLTGLNQNNVNVGVYRAVRRLRHLLNYKERG